VGAVADLVAAFHAQHEREFNFRRDDAPVDVYRLNLRAIGTVPKAELAAHEPTGKAPEPRERRPVWFGAAEPFDTPIYWRDDLPAGVRLAGPAIVEQLDSTTVIPPGSAGEVDSRLNILIRVEDER
jgi:N-methylhydantoinase A